MQQEIGLWLNRLSLPQELELMKEAVGKYFDESEFAVILGGPEIGAEFSAYLSIICFTLGAEGLRKF